MWSMMEKVQNEIALLVHMPKSFLSSEFNTRWYGPLNKHSDVSAALLPTTSATYLYKLHWDDGNNYLINNENNINTDY